MPHRHDDLFAGIADFQALHRAARRAIRGKRRKPGAAAFMTNLETELLRLERELRDGSWRPGRYVTIAVKDPKPRMVSAAPFRDRVVHHALHAVIEPIFERGFIHDSYANRNRNTTGNRNNNNGFRVASTPQAGAGGFTDPPGAHGCVQGRS